MQESNIQPLPAPSRCTEEATSFNLSHASLHHGTEPPRYEQAIDKDNPDIIHNIEPMRVANPPPQYGGLYYAIETTI